MADAELPDLEGEDEEGDADEGGEPLEEHSGAEGIGAVEEGEGGVVADAGEGYDVGEEAAEPGAVDGQGVLGGLDAAVGHGVEDLQGFGGPEGEGGLEDDEAVEQTGAAQDGEEEEENSVGSPGDAQGVGRPEEDEKAL